MTDTQHLDPPACGDAVRLLQAGAGNVLPNQTKVNFSSNVVLEVGTRLNISYDYRIYNCVRRCLGLCLKVFCVTIFT